MVVVVALVGTGYCQVTESGNWARQEYVLRALAQLITASIRARPGMKPDPSTVTTISYSTFMVL